jgi:hypothetical protein
VAGDQMRAASNGLYGKSVHQINTYTFTGHRSHRCTPFEIFEISLLIDKDKVLLNYKHGYHPKTIKLIISLKSYVLKTGIDASLYSPYITRINASMN